MTKRKLILIVLFIIVLVVLLFTSCTTLTEKKEPIKTIFTNYSQATEKKASALATIGLSISFKLNLEGYDNVYEVKFVQIGKFDRIESEGKIIIDVDAYAGIENEEKSDISVLNGVLRLKGYTGLADVICDYFKDNTTMANILIGYDGKSTYNLKAGYFKKNGEKEYQKHYAVNQSIIAAYQNELSLASSQKFLLKNIMLTNDIFSLANNPAYLVNDTAPLRFDVQENAFLYSYILNNEAFKQHLFKSFEDKILAYFLLAQDEEIQDSYEAMRTSIKNWFTIERTYATARANADNMLTNMDLGLTLAMIVPNKELKNVFNLASPGLGDEIANLISDINIGIDLSIKEQYSYNLTDISLDSYAEHNLFADTNQNVPGRKVLSLEDLFDIVTNS